MENNRTFKSFPSAFISMSHTIKDCHDFLENYGKKSWTRCIKNFAFARSIQERSKELNERLTNAINDLKTVFEFDDRIDIKLRKEEENASATDLIEIKKFLIEHITIALEENQVGKSDKGKSLKGPSSLEFSPDIREMIVSSTEHHAAIKEAMSEEEEENHSGKSVKEGIDRYKNSNTKPKSNLRSLEDIDLGVLQWSKDGPVLGEGGFGKVFPGHYFGEAVAIKYYGEIENLLKKNEIELIRKEARIMQLLRHKNVIALRGFSLSKGLLVMEKANFSLFQLLHQRDKIALPVNFTFSVEGKMKLCLEIAYALRYLHHINVLHRDIKPQNVLLLHDNNGTMVAKVADFGLAVVVNHTSLASMKSRRAVSSPAGTALYQSPEVLDCNPHTPSSDIYSYGILANEVFTEESPWQQKSGISLTMYQVSLQTMRGNRPMAFIPTDKREEEVLNVVKGCWLQEAADRPSAVTVVEQLQKTMSDAKGLEKEKVKLQYILRT